MSDPLEEKIDDLYGLEPDRFVAERDALARSLREDGSKAEAEEIARLRKPTLAVWAVNQLARQRRRDVDLLLDAGHRLVGAQQAALEGRGREEFDQARTAVQTALARLRGHAEGLLAGRGSSAALGRVEETLRAAAVSDEGRELLARGRLTAEAKDTGWDLLASLKPAKTRGDTPERGRRTGDDTRAERAQLKEAQEHLREMRALRAEAEKRVRRAERGERDARDALEMAVSDLHAAREELRAATEAIEAAEAALDDRRKKR